jgi:SWI/SNF-related matrix-associated actin-dependent regulator 1 of chromatin subfamily A
VQAVLIANALRPQRVTIVCPASVKLNWVHEWKRWSTLPLTVGVVTSNDVPDADVLVVNYDIVNRHVERLACDLLIVDEAHYIKNERSQRARAVKAIRAKHRIYMTGTPIMNRPVELWSLVHDLDPAVFSDFFRFARRYCDAKQVPAGRRLVWDFSGASNLDELHRLLRQRIMIRRLKADVLNELPPKVRQVVHLDVDDRIARLIQLEREALEEARLDAEVDAMLRRIEEGGADEWLDAVERLVDVTSSIDHIARIRHQLATAKVPQAVAYIEDVLASAPQVVVFAHHRDVVSALCERLQPYGVVSIVGGDNAEARQEAVERFQRGEASVFVGSITAAGTGITLTKADTVVFVELDWVPANVLQAEDRCHRIGQRDSVFVYYLVVDGSLDARMARALARKLDLVREAVG